MDISVPQCNGKGFVTQEDRDNEYKRFGIK